MIVRGPMHSIDARGKMGSIFVYSIWRGINYIRDWAKPTGLPSVRQTRVRGLLQSGAQAWADLTTGIIAAWIEYAEQRASRMNPVGALYKVSGMNDYIGLRSVVVDAGALPASFDALGPPISGTVEPFASCVLTTPGPGAITLTCNDVNDALIIADIWLAGPKEPQQAIRDPELRHIVFMTTLGSMGVYPLISLDPGKYSAKIRAISIDMTGDTTYGPSQFLSGGEITIA